MTEERFEIDGITVAPGETKTISLSVATLHDYTEVNIPIRVVRGSQPGPVLLVCAAAHGDELNGVEIVKRLLRSPLLARILGVLIAVPILNVFGYNNRSRYLPDQRDLNRSFPGSEKGSLASRLAHMFLERVVSKAAFAVDLHTGSVHLFNLPQVRVSPSDPQAKHLALAFGAPVVLSMSPSEGSLRAAALKKGTTMLAYEGGEGLRLDRMTIRLGVKGILSVMRQIGMIQRRPSRPGAKRRKLAFEALASHWVRAPHSGSFTARARVGKKVEKHTLLGVLSDPFGENRTEVRARETGIIITQNQLPLVTRGDTLFRVATFRSPESVEETMEQYDDYLDRF